MTSTQGQQVHFGPREWIAVVTLAVSLALTIIGFEWRNALQCERRLTALETTVEALVREMGQLRAQVAAVPRKPNRFPGNESPQPASLRRT